MPRIPEYDTATSVADTNLLVLETATGTKSVAASDVANYVETKLSVANRLDVTTPGGYMLDAYQGKVLDDKISALSETVPILASGEWTVKLYDFQTYLRDIGTGYYYRIGNLVYAFFAINNPNLSGISTMLIISGYPFIKRMIMGQIYIAGMSGNGGDRTLQAQYSDTLANTYFRPNILSSNISNPTAPGMFTCCLVGVVE